MPLPTAKTNPKVALLKQLWTENPVFRQVLGICSALAVTNLMFNTLLMCLGLIWTTVMTNITVSALRNYIPQRVRMMVQVLIIACYVIIVDIVLQAKYPDIHRVIGPYVGLIITNCIIMGRAEAFALQNPPLLSIVDGLGNGLGYAAVLAIIGLFRELLGTGKVLFFEKIGLHIDFTNWYTPNQVMILAPGAFIAMGFLIALYNHIKGPETEEKKP